MIITDAQWIKVHSIVMDVMIEHGPDGHVDGSDRILNAVLDTLDIPGSRLLYGPKGLLPRTER